jgi:glycosyltransferase involved in cell wall biosynthesis
VTPNGVHPQKARSAGRRLRLGIALRSNTNWMGGHHYVLSCLDALLALPADERPEIFLLWSSPTARNDAKALAAQVDGHAHLAMASRLGLDFVYPVKELSEAPSGVPWGGWIVDWQQRHLPEMFTRSEHAMREMRYRVMAESAPIIAHGSTQALEDTRRWVPSATADLGVLHFRATLETEILAGDLDDTRRRYRLPARFAVVSNQWFRHKNHAVVIEALRILRTRGVIIPCVVTGRPEDHRWPEYGASIERRIEELGLSNVVRLVGLVPRADQVQLIRAASVVIQPSLFEGWSTIVEEARSLGKTIVLSDIPVHREQSPPHGHFFDPYDPSSLADVLEQAWGTEFDTTAAVREQVAHAEHTRLQADAGYALLDVARRGISRYDPVKHDPARILLRLAHEALLLKQDGDRARSFVGKAVRVWFTHHPWRFPGFAANLLEADPATRAWIATEVLPDMAQNSLRVRHMSWIDQAPVRLGWYPALIEAVHDLALLPTAATSAAPADPAVATAP